MDGGEWISMRCGWATPGSNSGALAADGATTGSSSAKEGIEIGQPTSDLRLVSRSVVGVNPKPAGLFVTRQPNLLSGANHLG